MATSRNFVLSLRTLAYTLRIIFVISLFLAGGSHVFAGNCQPLSSREECSVDTAQGKVVVYRTTVNKVSQCSVWLELPDGSCDLVANRVDCTVACLQGSLAKYKVSTLLITARDASPYQ